MDFTEEYKKISRRAYEFNEKARREGLLALEEEIDQKKANERDIFEFGMRFTVDGSDASFIDKVLTNIIKQEKDEQMILLKTIQKEAVLAIQRGNGSGYLLAILNSYTNLFLNEDEVYSEFYNDLYEGKLCL